MRLVIFSITAIFSMFLTSCNDKDSKPPPEDPIITTTTETINFNAQGGTSTVITMNGDFWAVYSDKEWCTVSKGYSSNSNEQLTDTVAFNPVKTARAAELRFIMDEKDTVFVEVLQEELKDLYPVYSNWIARDLSGMPNSAPVLAAKMFAGWNLGNALEAPGGEIAWGNPAVTQQAKNYGLVPFVWDNGGTDNLACGLFNRATAGVYPD